MELPEKKTPLERLNDRLQEKSMSLHFNRVPVRVKREFVAWADEEFCGDYGLAFKHLWDSKLDVAEVAAQIASLHTRIAQLELAQNKEEQPKVRRMVGGNVIPRRSE